MNTPARPPGHFASLESATFEMDVTEEPVLATTQLLFMPPAAAPAPAPAAAAPADNLPAEPEAMLQELLARVDRHRRRR
jgi:hypothetical protein